MPLVSAMQKLESDAIICSLGWNCYPGLLLRYLYSQPTFPWDWMQFFEHSALKNLLTEQGIDEVVSEYVIKNIKPGLEADPDKPHFWNERLRIRSPHDHERSIFKDIASSKQVIAEKLLRRLGRLRATCKGRDLVFLCSYNFGCYGLKGFSWSSYLYSMREILEMAGESLSPSRCSVVLCGRKRPCNRRVFDGESFAVERLCDDVFYCATIYDFEDAYFKKTSAEVDVEYVRDKYWFSVLPATFDSIKRMS